MRRCVCPGSFDPVTHGHLDVVRRAAALFDEVVIAVLQNPGKAPLFTVEERVAMLQDALADGAGTGLGTGAGLGADPRTVRVVQGGGGLLVDLCRRVGAVAVVKGVRGGADLEHELPMARMNRHLSGVETVLLPADPATAHVSSTLVREVATLGGDVSGLVPDAVLPLLRDRVAARRSR